MAAPQIIINAILYPLGVAYRHGGHTQTCLRKSIPHHDSCSDAGAKRNAGDQALLDLVATARSKAMNMASCTKGDRMTSPGFECCQAAVGRSRACSSNCRNSGFGARHMVRNVSRKGSQISVLADFAVSASAARAAITAVSAKPSRTASRHPPRH